MINEHKQFNLPDQNFPVSVQTQNGNDFDSSVNLVYTPKTLNVKKFHILGEKEFETNRGIKVGRFGFNPIISGSIYTLNVSQFIIGVTNLSYSPTIGLPKPFQAGAGKIYIVKDEVGGAATTTITVRSAGEENIDGAATSTITTNYGSKEFYTDGANWFTK